MDEVFLQVLIGYIFEAQVVFNKVIEPKTIIQK